MSGDFVHLHLHTEYSLLDGACRIDSLIEKVKALGQSAVAITDHGVMYGCVEFYRKAKAAGIKPIIGCEVYVATRSRTDKVRKADGYYHLVLLVKNRTGYQNLIKMVTLAYTEGFYSKPRIDRRLLQEYHEGLVCLSGCIAGEIPRALLADDVDRAVEAALFYKNLFGDDFYIELMDHGLEDERQVLPQLMRLASETGIRTVATNDCHYVEKRDSEMQRALICIRTKRLMSDPNPLEFETEEFYIKSSDEMRSLFSYLPSACENTLKIAEKCNFDYDFGVSKLPAYRQDSNLSNERIFEELCRQGLKKRYSTVTKALSDRLEYEINVIKEMKFVDYYLIVHDFVNYARNNGIPVGPGRGSGAASLRAYCCGITEIDPIKYDLIFERFLNPERISMPDFDVDFCSEKRSLVVDYVRKKYGSDHVCNIISFGTLKARAAVRDIGRVMGMPYNAVDRIAKMIPAFGEEQKSMTIESAMAKIPELRKAYDTEPLTKQLLDMAAKVEGMPRNVTVHPAGVVITDRPVMDYVPLEEHDGALMAQFEMGDIELLGLLKIDFLGLQTLTIISKCEEMIKKAFPDFSVKDIPYDDPDTYKLFCEGRTNGIFQFESEGMKKNLIKMKPCELEDLVAAISLYRPGPMASISTFIYNRFHPERVEYKHPLLENILKDTNGCLVYQEQVMEICRALAGYSYGQADIVRRAMGKKKPEEMEKEREHFIRGCTENGIDKKISEEIFEDMSAFASYGYNKPHAVAYAYIAYQTAYLKAHFPRQFWAANISAVSASSTKLLLYMQECRKSGIQILPADVNRCYSDFSVEGKSLRYGLAAVKNVGRAFVDKMVREREENGEFLGVFDFCERMSDKGLTNKTLECLIKVGAFDSFGKNRRSLYVNTTRIFEKAERNRKGGMSGQLALFDEPDIADRPGSKPVNGDDDIPDLEDFTLNEKLDFERDLAGIYLSNHPLDIYKEQVDNISTCTISQLVSDDNRNFDGTRQTIVIIFRSYRFHKTKNGETMVFAQIEDKTGVMDMIIFPSVLAKNKKFGGGEGNVAVVSGKVSLKDDEATFIADDIYRMYFEEVGHLTEAGKNPRYGLYLKIWDEKDTKFSAACNILKENRGALPVFFYFARTKQYMKAPEKYFTSIRSIPDLNDLLGYVNVNFTGKR